ncbi:MAG: hypothetical protein JKX76_10445 [Colwellia sp.]|nr:hypothetical protein [Colwellia sp.]
MKVKLIDKLVPNSVSKHLRRWRYEHRYKRKFKELHGYELNEASPKTFAEKLFYRKRYGNFDELSKFSDKYKVRDYVENKIGKQYLIPLLGVYDQLTLDDLSHLPNQFVVKTTHGSGKKHIEIVHDKSSHNLKKLVKKMNYALTLDFGYDRRELWYTKVEKKIVIEEFLISTKDVPDDYKCHCFGGNSIYISVDIGRFQDHKRSVFDENWTLTDISLNCFPPVGDYKAPINFELMKSLALKLASPFDYIRVDFYNIDGKIYFGEMTLSPANGMEILEPRKYETLWGKLWKLDKKNQLLYSQE